MRHILKLNDIPIWNLTDLQREFSPMAAYERLPDFCDFARVHCIPLPQVLVSRENGKLYAAKYFTKSFWYSILTRQDWPEEVTSPEACLDELVRPLFEQEIGGGDENNAEQGEEERLRLSRERTDAAISEKLTYIVASASLSGNAGDIRKAVTLLAICQIAEVNPLHQSFRAVEPDSDTPVPEEAEAAPNSDGAQSGGEPLITEFPFEKTAVLAASAEPYCYWYHDEEEPQQGSPIRTVCVKAQPGARPDHLVRIALFSPTTGACVQEITLKKGEFRYCNVSSGRIIGFLPDGTVSSDLAVVRDSYAEKYYTVIPRDADTWKLNQQGITMAATASQQDGFLLLMDGKVSTAFYKPARDYMVQLQFDMVMMPVVELQVTTDGCRLLLEDGTVLCQGRKEPRRCVTLAENRSPLNALNDPAVSQLVLSEKQDALVIFWEDRQAQVCFDGADFQLEDEHHVQLL